MVLFQRHRIFASGQCALYMWKVLPLSFARLVWTVVAIEATDELDPASLAWPRNVSILGWGTKKCGAYDAWLSLVTVVTVLIQILCKRFC